MGLSYPSGAEPVGGSRRGVLPARTPPSCRPLPRADGARGGGAQRRRRGGGAPASTPRSPVTRRRLRALDKRWLPWLRAELADVELSLEQTEQEDALRLRRAAAGRSGEEGSS